MPDDKRWEASWADLFLALFYSATIVLLVSWIRSCQLPDVPPPLANMVGRFSSWVIAGLVSAAVSAILRKRLSWLVLVWTVVLTCFLLFVLRCGPPASQSQIETWLETEGGRGSFRPVCGTGSGSPFTFGENHEQSDFGGRLQHL